MGCKKELLLIKHKKEEKEEGRGKGREALKR